MHKSAKNEGFQRIKNISTPKKNKDYEKSSTSLIIIYISISLNELINVIIHAMHKVLCSFFINFGPDIQNYTFKLVRRMKLFVIDTYLTYTYSRNAFHCIQIRREGGPFLYLNMIGCRHWVVEEVIWILVLSNWKVYFLHRNLLKNGNKCVSNTLTKSLLFLFDGMKISGRVLRLQKAPHIIILPPPKFLLDK